MTFDIPVPQTALKYELEVRDEGRIELHLPYAAGSRVVVIILPETQEQFTDLQAAATSSLAFWDNSFDDEDWN